MEREKRNAERHMTDDHQRFYDAKYAQAAQGFSTAFPRQIEFLLHWTRAKGKPLRILDLGGGTGEFSLMMQHLGHEVTLFELSQVAVESARRIGVRNTMLGDFIKEPPPDRYDVVLVKGFSPLNTDNVAEFESILASVECLLCANGVVLYWGVTDLSGEWTKSGWYCWSICAFRQFFDEVLIFPALRYQALVPLWISKVISNVVSRANALPRPLTLVAYKRKKNGA